MTAAFPHPVVGPALSVEHAVQDSECCPETPAAALHACQQRLSRLSCVPAPVRLLDQSCSSECHATLTVITVLSCSEHQARRAEFCTPAGLSACHEQGDIVLDIMCHRTIPQYILVHQMQCAAHNRLLSNSMHISTFLENSAECGLSLSTAKSASTAFCNKARSTADPKDLLLPDDSSPSSNPLEGFFWGCSEIRPSCKGCNGANCRVLRLVDLRAARTSGVTC